MVDYLCQVLIRFLRFASTDRKRPQCLSIFNHTYNNIAIFYFVTEKGDSVGYTFYYIFFKQKCIFMSTIFYILPIISSGFLGKVCCLCVMRLVLTVSLVGFDCLTIQSSEKKINEMKFWASAENPLLHFRQYTFYPWTNNILIHHGCFLVTQRGPFP